MASLSRPLLLRGGGEGGVAEASVVKGLLKGPFVHKSLISFYKFSKYLRKPIIGENIWNLNDINAVWGTSETVSNIGNLFPLLGFPSGRWPWSGHTRYQFKIFWILPSLFLLNRSIDTNYIKENPMPSGHKHFCRRIFAVGNYHFHFRVSEHG